MRFTLIPKDRSKPYTYSGLVNAHNRALEKSKTSFDVYGLRHTFASRLYDRTKDIVAVARMLGHADLKTVMRYLHVDQEQMAEAMRKFSEGLKPLQEKTVQ